MAKTARGRGKRGGGKKSGGTAKTRAAKRTVARRAADSEPPAGTAAIDVGAAVVIVKHLQAKLQAAREGGADPEAVDPMLDAAEAFLDVWVCESKTMTRVF